MELRVLGPLELSVEGVPVPLGAPKLQGVLAMLALHFGRPVTIARFVDELWPEAPPPSAVPNVRAYVAGVRRVLDSGSPPSLRVVRQPGGYVLTGDTRAVDLYACRAEVAAGERALREGDDDGAVERFTAALAMWRGAMLAGMAVGPLLAAVCTTVEEERLTLVERLADLHLTRGDAVRALGLLREHVHSHPTREQAQAALMRALYQAGDTAAALEAYARARRVLVDELGVEPGRELRDVHAAVLNRDPALEGPGRRTTAPATGGPAHVSPARTAWVRPRELPPELSRLVGREHEARAAMEILSAPVTGERSRARVVVFHGPGGLGKSALAVHVSHRAGDAFPDGHLYIDLLGSTPGLRQSEPADVLRRLLRGLGIPGGDIPQGLADLIAAWRTRTADGRYLLLLDNARDAGQVSDLVPAGPGSAVVITSRHPLPTLDVDHRVRLRGLTPEAGTEMLRHLGGDVGLDERTAHRIVELCDHLPLALRIVGGRLAGQLDATPGDLLDRLRDRRRRLDELELDGVAVRSSISVGLDALAGEGTGDSERALRAFRVLAVAQVPTFGPGLVAAILHLTEVGPARTALLRLAHEGLIDPVGGGRYRMHDLVRLVADEVVRAESAPARAEVLRAASVYYAATLRRADAIIRPVRAALVPEPPAAGVLIDEMGTVAEASTWIDAELRNLAVVVMRADGECRDVARLALVIAEAMWDPLYRRYEWLLLRRIGEAVLRAGRRHRDEDVLAYGHTVLGRLTADSGDPAGAARHFEDALAHYRRLENHVGVGLTLSALGVAAQYADDAALSLTYLSEALAVADAHDVGPLRRVAQLNLVLAHCMVGDWARAHETCSALATESRRLSDRPRLIVALVNLALIRCHRGQLDDARHNAGDALDLSREMGDRLREHEALLIRSEIYVRLGWYGHAHADVAAVLESTARGDDGYSRMLALRQQAKLLVLRGDLTGSATARLAADGILTTAHTRHPTLRKLFEATMAQVSTVDVDREAARHALSTWSARPLRARHSDQP